MADLLQSLLTTWPAHLQPRTEASSGSSTRQPKPQALPGDSSDMPTDTDHVFVDADEYLQGIFSSLTSPTASKNGPPAINPTIQPVQIGRTRTSEHSVAFHHLAQEKRITYEFVFNEPIPQQFSVTLTLGGQRVVEEQGLWPSKKAAKEAVCAKARQVLKDMEGTLMPTQETGENWVGMLQGGAPRSLLYISQAGPQLLSTNKFTEYYDGRDNACPRPTYTEFAVGNLFACEVVIDQCSSSPFGGRYSTFSNKKAAKTNAAREAVQWLTENNSMGPQGPARKKRKSGAVMPESGTTVEINRVTNFTQKVNALCPKFGLSPPEYRLSSDPRSESMYSGAAYFNDPILPSEPIGDVRNVYGKKKAKEEISKAVLAFLKEWAKKQGVELREKD
ncbi:MAG: hypothetical protein M1840_002525 [Geoglossum simile]|nr:MAG: hypothetical protein M1840_002525 [Geoglossum simile]